jgi:DNA-binding MarR family transcriptional regulator
MAPPMQDTSKRVEARAAALRKALEDSLTRKEGREGHEGQGRQASTPLRRAPLEQRRFAEHDLIGEITSTAQAIADARDWNGQPVCRVVGIWRVLATVASSQCCLAIADLGRALRVRKQTARELAHAAVRAGVIELAPNRDDKRILQLLLTPRGRAELAAARTAEEVWLALLLNGLGDHELAAVTRVVRVIRQRLERDARELARQRAKALKSRQAQWESS